MSRDIAPFGVRLPAEVKDDLTKKAKDNKRSLNAEIVSRLEISLYQDEVCPNGHEFVHQDLEEALGKIDRLEAELSDLTYDVKNKSIRTSIEELRDKIDDLIMKTNG